jgi:hypothetical protein
VIVKVTYQVAHDPEDSEMSISVDDSDATPHVGDLVVVVPHGQEHGAPHVVLDRYWTIEEHEPDRWLQHLTVVLGPKP